MSRIVAAFDSFWFCGLIRAPTDPNCLLISAAAKNAAGDMQAAQSTMQRLLKADPSFSLAGERTYRRFGASALTERFLARLANAKAPEIKSSGAIGSNGGGFSVN